MGFLADLRVGFLADLRVADLRVGSLVDLRVADLRVDFPVVPVTWGDGARGRFCPSRCGSVSI